MAEVLDPVAPAVPATSATLVARPTFKPHYDNYIGGKFTPPVKGQYFDNPSPIDGQVFTKVARSTKEDIDLALDAAHEAFKTWKSSSATTRSNMLNKIADELNDRVRKRLSWKSPKQLLFEVTIAPSI